MKLFLLTLANFLGGLERPDVDKIDGLSPSNFYRTKKTPIKVHVLQWVQYRNLRFFTFVVCKSSDAYSYNTGEKWLVILMSKLKN
ncbi:UNVERIFIED_CONTAM: hypothetical protein GTU68_061364 [Idotea baltica]|nr:hypothetical protein [Idotea baltica]